MFLIPHNLLRPSCCEHELTSCKTKKHECNNDNHIGTPLRLFRTSTWIPRGTSRSQVDLISYFIFQYKSGFPPTPIFIRKHYHVNLYVMGTIRDCPLDIMRSLPSFTNILDSKSTTTMANIHPSSPLATSGSQHQPDHVILPPILHLGSIMDLEHSGGQQYSTIRIMYLGHGHARVRRVGGTDNIIDVP